MSNAGTGTDKFTFNQAGTYKYTISETTVPNGYDKVGNITLTIVVGTDSNNNLKVNSSTINSVTGVSYNSGTAALNIIDPHKVIKIEGTVWQDADLDKSANRNGRIDSSENRMQGIKVTLKQDNKAVKTTTTNNKGEYTFNDVLTSDATTKRMYTVEFEYDGMTYTSTKFDPDTKNGQNTSKAEEAENTRRTFNSKFQEYIPGQATGTAGNINLSYSTTGGSQNKYAESKLNTNGDAFKIQASTPSFEAVEGANITNVNLGLVRRKQADFSLQQGIRNVKATINGTETTITKNIADEITGDEIKEYLVKRNDIRNYYIKNSDYTYRIGDYKDLSDNQKNADQSEELELYITYMIAVKNTGSVAGTVNEIKNYYSNTYTITNVETTGNKKINYTNLAETNGYKSISINANELGELTTGGTKWIYITYKVNKDNSRAIQLGNKAVIAEINKYTTYKANMSLQNEKDFNGVVDKDSAPGNLDVTKGVETHEDDTAKAATINITNNGRVRSVTGIAWDDDNKDGIKNENIPVNGVIVQLVEIYKGQEFIWKEMETGTDKVDYIKFAGGKATATVTKSNGTYKFEDFIPGDYVLRFKYGETVETVKLQNGKSYNGHEFESTIYGKDSKAQDRSDRRAEVLNNTKTVDNKLGKLLVSPYNNPTDEDIQKLIDLTKMTADTATMRVDSESEGFGEINLGLKERKKDNITVEKNISHITLTLNNGTVYLDTDYPIPAGASVDGLLDIPENPWISMAQEIINGATLKVQYRITLKNDSDDNKITGIKLIDYLPENMKIDYGVNNEWEAVDKNNLSDILDEKIVEPVAKTGKAMITNKDGITLDPRQGKDIYLEATTTLSSQMDTYNFINVAEIIKYTSENGRRNSQGVPGNQDPTEYTDRTPKIEKTPNESDLSVSEEVIIAIPTGGDKSGTAKYYYLLGMMIGITTIAGIAFVKKYKV